MTTLIDILQKIPDSNQDIRILVFEGYEIAFYLPSHKQIKQYKILLEFSEALAEKNAIYESVCYHFVINKSILREDDLPAGMPYTIFNLMLLWSGELCQESDDYIEFNNSILQVYRDKNDNLDDYVKSFICHVFPGYTFEQLNKLSYLDLFDIYVKAEKMALKFGKIEDELRLQPKQKETKESPDYISKLIQEDKKMWDQAMRDPKVNIRDTSEYQSKMQQTQDRMSRLK